MIISNSKQIKISAVLSYILIIVNALYGLLLTPFIINCIGEADYGVYKVMTALTSSLMVIDLGLGGTVQRYIANFIAKKQEDKIPNFLAMSLIFTSLFLGVLILIAFILYLTLDATYSNFTVEQLSLAKKIFIVSCIDLLVIFVSNVFTGVITGFNKFIFSNAIGLILLFTRIILIILFLTLRGSVFILSFVNLLSDILLLLISFFYISFNLKIKIIYKRWEKGLFLDAGKYTVLMFISSIVSQIISNMDNVIIGAIKGPDFVTVYSIGLMIFSMFSNLSCAVSGLMLPSVTNAINSTDGKIKTQNIIIKAGRFQFIILGAALTGFICIGRDFINVWMGNGYEDVYIITLILIIPSLFELCINTCLSVLRAMNRLEFRTFALILSAVINAIITVILVSQWSYIGAAVGTAISYVLCSLIAMNIYYYKVLKLHMLFIYKSIIGKVWICLIISATALLISSHYLFGSWFAIIIDICVFCLVYGFCLFLFGLSKEEKLSLPIIRSFIK